MMGLRSCREVSELVSQGLDREFGFGVSVRWMVLPLRLTFLLEKPR